MNHHLPAGVVATSYYTLGPAGWQEVEGAVVEETAVCIHVNGLELATLLCTPIEQEAMALGFLRAEGFISSLQDVELIELSHSGACVDVWLKHEIERPERRIRTSGCGGGLTFDDLTAERDPLAHPLTITFKQIEARYRDLRSVEQLYTAARGVHASALCTPDELLLLAEDVGRHNTLDKLWGKAMLQNIETEGRLIITTGRISSEMLGKAAKMKIPVVASRTSPTSRSVALARAWNITIAGYIRRGGMRIYSAPQRVLPAALPERPQIPA